MLLEEVEAKLAEIRHEAKSGDYESAHMKEDILRETFIEWVLATGLDYQKQIAKQVLSSNDIDFTRWYA